MIKFSRHWIYFWVTAILFLITITSISDVKQFLTFLVITLIVGIINYLKFITSGITIENNIVNGRYGIIHTQKLSSNKSNISSVKVDKGILGRILNYGTINIDSASSHYTFKMMKNPDQIKDMILK